MNSEYQIISQIRFAPEDVLPIQTIREHSKTDDTPTVTDGSLMIYRDFAFEQAELYTGRFIFGHANILEKFRVDGSRESDLVPRRSKKLKLKYAPTERQVIVSDFTSRNKQVVHVNPNTRKIDVKPDVFGVNMGNCCAGNGMEYQAQVMYTSGYKTKDDIPSTILYGCLKLLTWAIFNPGDELLTVRNRLGTTETGLIGTNNGAWASGAIEHWKTYQVT